MMGLFKTSAALATVMVGSVVAAVLALPQLAVAHDEEHVDLEGVWIAYATIPSGRLGALSPKLTDEGKAAVKAFTDEYGTDHPEAGWYCVGTGMPYAMPNLASYPVEILQTPSHTVMLLELEQQVRRVYTDGREMPEDYPRTRMGYSIGHWEGKTFVVTTANFKDWPLGSAPRSEDMVITEEFTLTTQDKIDVKSTGFVAAIPAKNDKVLIDHMTLTDPRYYSEPLTVDIYYQEVTDDNTLEYDCTTDLWQRAMDAHKEEISQ